MLSSKKQLITPFELNIYCKDCIIQQLNDTSSKKFAPVPLTDEHLRRRFSPCPNPVAPISIPATLISSGISHILTFSHPSSDRLHFSSERLHIPSKNLNISLNNVTQTRFSSTLQSENYTKLQKNRTQNHRPTLRFKQHKRSSSITNHQNRKE